MTLAELIPLGTTLLNLIIKLVELGTSAPDAAKKALADLNAMLGEHLTALEARLAADDAVVDAMPDPFASPSRSS